MHIRQDEAHWCSVLVDAIRSLDAVPTRATGAFYEKAMAIDDLAARMAFLNRCQRWVVRKLQTLLPTLADPDIHQALSLMLVAHENNIGDVDARCAMEDRAACSGSRTKTGVSRNCGERGAKGRRLSEFWNSSARFGGGCEMVQGWLWPIAS
ncbi:hypothetical protein J2785_003301 [Burkholderia ambifaria]|nr:hypothetical protein [Burkholderia ambifaria]